MTDGRLSRESVEVAVNTVAPDARLSRGSVEVGVDPTAHDGRLSRLSVEVATKTTLPAVPGVPFYLYHHAAHGIGRFDASGTRLAQNLTNYAGSNRPGLVANGTSLYRVSGSVQELNPATLAFVADRSSWAYDSNAALRHDGSLLLSKLTTPAVLEVDAGVPGSTLNTTETGAGGRSLPIHVSPVGDTLYALERVDASTVVHVARVDLVTGTGTVIAPAVPSGYLNPTGGGALALTDATALGIAADRNNGFWLSWATSLGTLLITHHDNTGAITQTIATARFTSTAALDVDTAGLLYAAAWDTLKTRMSLLRADADGTLGAALYTLPPVDDATAYTSTAGRTERLFLERTWAAPVDPSLPPSELATSGTGLPWVEVPGRGRVYLHQLGLVTGLAYEYTYSGGASLAEMTLDTLLVSHVALQPGLRCGITVGAADPWTGITNNPSGDQPITLTWTGDAAVVGWYAAYDPDGIGNCYALDRVVDAAADRGMPFARDAALPVFPGKIGDDASVNIAEALDAVARDLNRYWTVEGGIIRMPSGVGKTQAYRLVSVGDPDGQTLDGYASTLLVAYTHITDHQRAIAVQNMSGTPIVHKEAVLDITSENEQLEASALDAAAGHVARLSKRQNFTGSFDLVTGQLLTLGGTPVDLATVTAGFRAYVVSVDPFRTGPVPDETVVVIGRTRFDATSGVLTCTPLDARERDVVSVLAR